VRGGDDDAGGEAVGVGEEGDGGGGDDAGGFDGGAAGGEAGGEGGGDPGLDSRVSMPRRTRGELPRVVGEGEADGVDGGGVERGWPATARMPSVPKSFFMSSYPFALGLGVGGGLRVPWRGGRGWFAGGGVGGGAEEGACLRCVDEGVAAVEDGEGGERFEAGGGG
jgi:hypothetical protein